ncbi:MAG: nucleotidyltransferase domain-containing protein [Planctomycetota bacterium]
MAPYPNRHLEPVFQVLLPAIDEAGIDYWVYGGIGIAASAGEFLRDNIDVDIFVKETEFENTRLILKHSCNQNNFKLLNCKPLRRAHRPKFEIWTGKQEILSVVPVYIKDDIVEFRFLKGPEEYPLQILQKVERNISGYRFFTPPDEYIKKLLMNYLKARSDKRKGPKIQIDAKAISVNCQQPSIDGC